MNLTEANNLINLSKHIHFIGIGGIGISAIARMMLQENKKVSGSDREESDIVNSLKKMGAKFYHGHKAGNIKNPDVVIYTPAILKDNIELKKAQRLKIPCLSYPEALGVISKNKYTVAISGTHGKTTTTAMMGKILKDSNLDPTIIVGSLVGNTNFIPGKSKYLVCEACEYKKSFLNLHPNIIVITNIDNDHLDYYGSLKNIQKAFRKFADKLSENDFLIFNSKDKNSLSITKNLKCKLIDYSKIKPPKDFKLKIPGKHNIENAKAAFAVAKILNIPQQKIAESLKTYSGVWRRFEYKGKTKNGALVYDDYGHHPTEIKATLKSAREYFGDKKIFAVFQPHLYSRTKILLNDLAKSFADADTVIITDIYAAREKKDKTISAQKLAGKIPNAEYISKFKDIEIYLKQNTGKNDVIITIGAGDIYRVGETFLRANVQREKVKKLLK